MPISFVVQFPPAIGEAKRLKSLLIGNNLFFGKLVTEIGKVTTLEKLRLGFNEFWRNDPNRAWFVDQSQAAGDGR